MFHELCSFVITHTEPSCPMARIHNMGTWRERDIKMRQAGSQCQMTSWIYDRFFWSVGQSIHVEKSWNKDNRKN